MGRNLYILAGTLGLFALVCFGISFTNIAQQPGSPGDMALWQTMAIGFLVLGMVIALAGMLSSLFEQGDGGRKRIAGLGGEDNRLFCRTGSPRVGRSLRELQCCRGDRAGWVLPLVASGLEPRLRTMGVEGNATECLK